MLPASGHYVSLGLYKGRPIQGFHDSVHSLTKACLTLDSKGIDSYFCVSTFVDKAGGRKQGNVQAIQVVPVDIDCGPGKPYATQIEGVRALQAFITAYSLPQATMVNSGGGIHAYWCLDQPATEADWKVVAVGLKTAAAAAGFHIDTGKTGDAACVLRPVGTHNYKQSPRPVALLHSASPTTLDGLRTRLAGFTVSSNRSHTASTSPLLKSLAVVQDYPLAEAGLIAEKCKQIKNFITNPANVTEPQWYDLMGIAAHCKDAEYVACSWSNGHPGYTEAKSLEKLQQWKASGVGPTLCNTFRDKDAAGCEGCKFSGKLTTPLHIGVRRASVDVATTAPDEEAFMVPMPKGFKRTANGIKAVIDDVEIDVCDYDLYPMGQGKDEHLGYEVSRFKWNRPLVGWSLLEIPARDLAEGGKDFGKCLGDAGIVPAHKTQGTYMSILLRNFMAELNKTKAATNLYSSMGWKEDFSEFVLGGTIYKQENGKVSKESIGLSRNAPKHILGAYSSRGTAADWIKFTSILNEPSLAYYRFVLGIAFGCPLWAFGGLGGVVVSLFGETGAGKTTIQNWIQSVYGNPSELLIPAVATQNATFSRLGVYNNLPATIDEMSVLPAKDTANFIYWASLGKDKPRLNVDAVERDARKFSTMIVGSTNMSLNAKLLNAKAENNALAMRLLELTIPRHPYFSENSDKGREIYSFLHANYGTAGPVYINHLVGLGVAKLRNMVNEKLATFRTTYGVQFSGEERFWEHAIVLSDMGNEIAHGLGLVSYDYRKGTEWVLSQVDPLRKGVKEQDMDCFDILGAFLNEHVGNSVVVSHTGTNSPHYDLNRLPRDELLIRYNLFRKANNEQFTSGVVYVNRLFFYRWLTANGHDPKTLRQQLADLGAVAQPAGDKYYMGKDTGIRSGQIYVIGVNLAHARMAGVLNDAEANAGLGELKEAKA